MSSAPTPGSGTAYVDDVRCIMEMLPHRYPFLMVDRVVSFEAGVGITAYKNVTVNEGFFQGHFPGQPIMPGVLIMEALAQAGGIFVVKTLGIDSSDKLFLFTGIDAAKFRRPVVPGDRLNLEASLVRRKMNIWKMQGRATVDGELVAEGIFTAAIVDKGKM
ncbi:MAG: 3-hydroxyacyl-[acyl-carrier-protein] dehydratase FabZ [Desulfovibrionales bacterium GWA2_65_9]|nr:MAG: 3-hydroxyacyl-[acyl-carrier-protein] dehydratase FabZ [Desulfovibrionales bacterium GWA2_65_9]